MKTYGRVLARIAALLLLWGCYHLAAAQISPDTAPTAAMDHSHMPIAVPASAPRVQLSLILTRDAMSGFNLALRLNNYQLGPPPANITSMQELMLPAQDSDSGYIAGHAHLYINGVKIQRVYGSDVHLPASLFESGINQISLTLNNHGHMYWTQDGRQLVATLFINPAIEEPVVYRFESFPVETTLASGDF